MIKVLPIVILSVIIMGFIYVPAYGHTHPVRYDPKPNQVFNSVQSVPNKLSIKFTELPEVKASSIKVVDQNHLRVDKNDLSLDSQKKLSTSLDKSKMHAGVYTVNWLALDKDDGHITKGSYAFSIK